MIGWNNVLSRDYAEAVVNGLLDDDLESLIEALEERRDALDLPRCPGCGELLREPHTHGETSMRYLVIGEKTVGEIPGKQLGALLPGSAPAP